jgi:hypothetical protein
MAGMARDANQDERANVHIGHHLRAGTTIRKTPPKSR